MSFVFWEEIHRMELLLPLLSFMKRLREKRSETRSNKQRDPTKLWFGKYCEHLLKFVKIFIETRISVSVEITLKLH